MKKSIVAAAIAVMVFAGVSIASAQMVDIGTGQMTHSEFMALKSKVQGQQSDSSAAVSTPIHRPERYGMVEMARADFEALRDTVAGRNVIVEAKPKIKPVQMVNIGTGEMPLKDFIALKKMVEKRDAFILDHLAAILP